MALVRAMNSAISGLRAQQFVIDTVGNNLANATTTAFKSGRVEFQSLLSQTLRFGSAPSGFLGGIDPLQIGLGTGISTTTRNFNQGELETTGRPTDLAVSGSGFFIVRDAQGGLLFTRDGGFSINPANMLHDPGTGFLVQGVQADFNTFTIPGSGTVGNLSIPVGALSVAVATRNAVFNGNLNGGGAQALMGTTLNSVLLQNGVAGPAATGATLLTALARSTGTGSVSLGLSVGDVITVNASKGGRTLPTLRFSVTAAGGVPPGSTPPPVGFDAAGGNLDDFRVFLNRALGINTNPVIGGTSTVPQYGAIRDNDTNPSTPGVSFAATGVTTTSVTVAGVNFVTEGVLVGDVVRFNTGSGAGLMATVSAIGGPGNSVLTFAAPIAGSVPPPAVGDQFSVHEPAGVTITGGMLHVAGNVGSANAITNLDILNATDTISFGAFTQIEAAAGESVVTSATVFDSNGTARLVELTYVLETKGGVDATTGATGNIWQVFTESRDNRLDLTGGGTATSRSTGNGRVTFTNGGQFLSANPASASGFISINIPNAGAQTPLNVAGNFAEMTGFSSTVSSAFLESQDGFPVGTLRDFSIAANGVITGIFSNGITRPIGQIHLARFANPNGLEELGDSHYQQASNSGTAVIGAPGTAGIGTIVSGALEASNVDFAQEFSDLIVAQRAFQADARVISTVDELLEELVNIL